jgi:hypothetical protein
MPTPFPGMDPYLEQRGVWNQVHADLIVDIRRFLMPLLRPKYHVGIEQRTYLALLPPCDDLVGIPDALVVASGAGRTMVAATPSTVAPEIGVLPQPEEMRERYLEIRSLETQQVVTVIELLSPGNKLSREGRAEYEHKRLDVLSSRTNLVEIDLIRAGQPFPMQASRQSDYRIVVSRSRQRPRADLYLFDLPQPIPDIPIPLQRGEAEPVVPLNELLHRVYDQGGYDLIIDYSRPAEPPLREADAVWAHDLLARARQNGRVRHGEASA